MSKVSKIEKLACDTAKSIGLVPFYLTDENILEISKYKNPDHHNYEVEYLGAVTPIEVKEKDSLQNRQKSCYNSEVIT